MQISRLGSGRRVLVSITEITGVSDNLITTQEMFRHEVQIDGTGRETDRWIGLGFHPHSHAGAVPPAAARITLRGLLNMGTGLLLGVLSIISVLLALAVWLWGTASSREQRQVSLQHTEQQLARGSTAGAVPAGPAVAAANDSARPPAVGAAHYPGMASCSAPACSRAGSCH